MNRDIEALEKEAENIARRIKDLKDKKIEISSAILEVEDRAWKAN